MNELISRLSASFAVFLFAGCSTISVLSNSLDIPSDSAVTLGSVIFDHSSWAKRDDTEWMNSVAAQENGWREAILQSFHARAKAIGLDAGKAGSVNLTVRITDLEPGSQAARMWVGFGAGSGYLRATVDAGPHGAFLAEGKISGGFQDITGVCRDLGVAAADAAAASM